MSSEEFGPYEMVMSKQLDTPEVEYLTKGLNLSLATHTYIPKMRQMVRLLKPGKGESYKSIFLLLPVAKSFNSLLLPSITGSYRVADPHGVRMFPHILV